MNILLEKKTGPVFGRYYTPFCMVCGKNCEQAARLVRENQDGGEDSFMVCLSCLRQAVDMLLDAKEGGGE